MDELPVLFSTRATARALGVTIRTVQRMAAAGDLPPAYKIDGLRGAYLFQESTVRAEAERRARAA